VSPEPPGSQASAAAARALSPYLDGVTVERGPDGGLRAAGRVRPDFSGFEGHFPGNPILAGAFQLEMLAIVASGALGGLAVGGVEHARFRHMVRPDDPVEIVVGPPGPTDGTVRASLSVDGTRACQATFLVARG
jgi:3-hydroxymyristoyl/3-hydroxydecanoyl-(acyl carrier protein) dehydratase